MEKRDAQKQAATSDFELGRMELGGEGVGSPTVGQVAERALEIAEIEGRPGRPSADDYARAKEEVRGVRDEDVGVPWERADDGSARDLSEEPEDPSIQIDDLEAPDENEDLDNLVHEGVDEANHEQMLEGHREEESDELDEQGDAKGGKL